LRFIFITSYETIDVSGQTGDTPAKPYLRRQARRKVPYNLEIIGSSLKKVWVGKGKKREKIKRHGTPHVILEIVEKSR
jgi:hypothetical protein